MTWLDDLQRRLAIAGARSLGQQVVGQVGRTIRGESADVWAVATAEPVDASAGNAPECAWCPVCRAIRMARDSNPDLAGRVGETAGALMSAAHDVAAAIDASLSRLPGSPPVTTPPERPPSPERSSPPERPRPSERLRPPAPPGPPQRPPSAERPPAPPGPPQRPPRVSPQAETQASAAPQPQPGTPPSRNGQ